MTPIEKQLQECRQEMRKLGYYRYIRMGAISMLLRLQESGFFPQKPKLLVEKNPTNKQQSDMWNATIIENCLTNTMFLEAFMNGEELVAFWKTETIKGKEYRVLDLVPERFTKIVTIKMDYGEDK